jgi:hypothetical protein
VSNNSDVIRIIRDYGKATLKVAQLEAGKIGVIPAEAAHQNAGLAFERQLNARRSDLARLESEYMLALIADHKAAAADVIKAMGWLEPGYITALLGGPEAAKDVLAQLSWHA